MINNSYNNESVFKMKALAGDNFFVKQIIKGI